MIDNLRDDEFLTIRCGNGSGATVERHALITAIKTWAFQTNSPVQRAMALDALGALAHGDDALTIHTIGVERIEQYALYSASSPAAELSDMSNALRRVAIVCRDLQRVAAQRKS